MINFQSVLTVFNAAAYSLAVDKPIDIAFAGRTVEGEIYTPDPSVNFLNCNLLPNDIERRGLANGEAEVMTGGIYQITINATKEGKANPDMEALGIANYLRDNFIEGRILTSGTQDCKVTQCNSPKKIPNETHVAYAFDVIFECIA